MKYTVDIDYLSFISYEVEAKNEQEARDIAWEIFSRKTEEEIRAETSWLSPGSTQIYSCQPSD